MTVQPTAHVRGRCPLCGRTVNIDDDNGTIRFVRHRISRAGRGRGNAARCDGSGWLVEDDELVSMSPASIAAAKATTDLTAARRALRGLPPVRPKENNE